MKAIYITHKIPTRNDMHERGSLRTFERERDWMCPDRTR